MSESGHVHPTNESAQPPLVLLVEDNERSRSIRRELLQHEGCRVVAVGTVDDAIAAFEASTDIDVVITDISLSNRATDRSGLDLARFVRAFDSEIPIVAYTAAVASEEIPERDRVMFNRWYPKGSLDATGIGRSVTDAKELATEHRRDRQRGQ